MSKYEEDMERDEQKSDNIQVPRLYTRVIIGFILLMFEFFHNKKF